jgi:hypothetical protein
MTKRSIAVMIGTEFQIMTLLASLAAGVRLVSRCNGRRRIKAAWRDGSAAIGVDYYPRTIIAAVAKLLSNIRYCGKGRSTALAAAPSGRPSSSCHEPATVSRRLRPFADEMMRAALDINIPNYASVIVTTNEILDLISSLPASVCDTVSNSI